MARLTKKQKAELEDMVGGVSIRVCYMPNLSLTFAIELAKNLKADMLSEKVNVAMYSIERIYDALEEGRIEIYLEDSKVLNALSALGYDYIEITPCSP